MDAVPHPHSEDDDTLSYEMVEESSTTEEVQDKQWSLLIDATGYGTSKGEEPSVYITTEQCNAQAKYYAEEKFKGSIPSIVFRYLYYMFWQVEDKGMTYDSEKKLSDLIAKGQVRGALIDDVARFIRNVTCTDEGMKILGMIQLVGPALSSAAKAEKGIKIYIDDIHSNLSTIRVARLGYMLMRLREDYGFIDEKKKELKEAIEACDEAINTINKKEETDDDTI